MLMMRFILFLILMFELLCCVRLFFGNRCFY